MVTILIKTVAGLLKKVVRLLFSREMFMGVMICLLLVPSTVSAQVLITEIMYAPEGVDSKHEWIEVCNSTASSEDIVNWKFYENDTNHRLELVSGTATLSPGDCAVIADNADEFKLDYSSFSGNLFDSAFSLKNTGETIALKNEEGNEVDSVSYSDANGAKDDGNSLHRSGSSLTAGTPTPGSESGVVSSSDDGSGETSGGVITNVTSYSYESVTIEPPQDVYIRVPKTIVTNTHALTKFTLESYDAIGKAVEGGLIYWAFGDGGSASGREVIHNFLNEGTYTVNVTITVGTLSDEKNIEVVVVPLDADLIVEDNGEWVAVINKSEHSLDLSNWRLTASGQYFILPSKTIVSAEGAAKFSTKITKLTFLRGTQHAVLVYPNGKTALDSNNYVEPEVEEYVEKEITVEESIKPVVAKIVIPKAGKVLIIPEPIKNIKEVASVEKIDEVAKVQAAAVILGTAKESKESNNYWYFGLASLLLVAIVGILFARPRKLVVDSFEVIEVKE